MNKAVAIVRTLFLIFIVGFTVRALPFFWSVPRTLDEQYSRCAGNLEIVQRAAWLAIAWIALETAVGWWRAMRPAAPSPPAEPKPPAA